MHLLISSCVFYMWFIPIYILFLVALIIIDFYSAILIEKSGEKKKIFLIISIISTSLTLFVFKYFNFFSSNLNSIMNLLGHKSESWALNLILPIGLSFHTFQSLSYVIEVYRGNQKAEKHLGIYSLYVMFYPQLVAGPIERPQHLLPQFYVEHKFDYERMKSGLQLMFWGMYKKIVIADRLTIFVDHIFSNPKEVGGPALVLGAIFFSIQIYCDFSGYSDIARGAARVMGFNMINNFEQSYLSESTAELWRRHHVSLTSWFRDYVYIPLRGNSPSKLRKYYSILFTFSLSGLWHGANWTFVIWNGLNGLYIILSDISRSFREKFFLNYHFRALNILITFLLFTFSAIFFRIDSIENGFIYIQKIFSGWSYLNYLPDGINNSIFLLQVVVGQLQVSALSLALDLFLVFVFFFAETIQRDIGVKVWLGHQHILVRIFIYYFLILTMLFFGAFGERQFAYFQF